MQRRVQLLMKLNMNLTIDFLLILLVLGNYIDCKNQKSGLEWGTDVMDDDVADAKVIATSEELGAGETFGTHQIICAKEENHVIHGHIIQDLDENGNTELTGNNLQPSGITNETTKTMANVHRDTQGGKAAVHGSDNRHDDVTLTNGSKETNQHSRRRRESSDSPQYDNRHNGVTLTTFNEEYYDGGFGVKVAPDVAPPDAKAEIPVVTDLSCWVCDGRQDDMESCIFSRCEYMMMYNSTFSPAGFSCMRYEIHESIFSTKYVSNCSYTETTFYNPCEILLRPSSAQGIRYCHLCSTDGCNAWPRSKMYLVWTMLGLALCALCSCLFVCVKVYTKTTSLSPCPPEEELC